MPAKEADVLDLANMHNASFADDAFMRLIWGRTARDEFDRELSKDFSRRRAHVQKGIAPGFGTPDGMTLAFVVDTQAERGRDGTIPEEEAEEHLPGTDVGLFKEFMTMLNRVRAAYRERDSRFYREYYLPTSTDLGNILSLICPQKNIACTAVISPRSRDPRRPSRFSAQRIRPSAARICPPCSGPRQLARLPRSER